MKRFILLIILFFPALGFAQDTLQFEHDNLTRTYILYKPVNLPSNAPLVFVLHAYSGTSKSILQYSRMNIIADTANFAVCYPQGSLDRSGGFHWNANLNISTTKDVDFLTELASYLQKEHNLNPQRTFICGHSNGGYMSYTLACEAPEIFKAIGNVAGTMSGPSWNSCNPSRAIPILHIHGEKDPTVPIDGSMSNPGGWSGAPAVDTIIKEWALRNKCTELDSVQVSTNTKAYYHRNGTDKNEVWYYKIALYEHGWPNGQSGTGISASHVIWDFFSSYTPRTTSINNLNKNTFEIYPNPIQDFVTIRITSDWAQKFELFNMNGKKIRNGIINSNEYQLGLSGLPSGVYTIKVGATFKKVIKMTELIN
jgi:polyhydroxybutyrate depolymerase